VLAHPNQLGRFQQNSTPTVVTFDHQLNLLH
jgi:hypothetical protein